MTCVFEKQLKNFETLNFTIILKYFDIDEFICLLKLKI